MEQEHHLDEKETVEVRRLLHKYELQVTDIASPLFKTDWTGAPKSKYSPEKPQFGADHTFAQQGEVLERSIGVAKILGCNRIRCFDFWRLEDPKPFRAAMDEKLRETAGAVAPKKISLLLENEFACNTATGAEAARTLAGGAIIELPAELGPRECRLSRGDGVSGWLRKTTQGTHRAHALADGSYEWAAMGRGIIDYAGQFRALLKAGYSGTMSLETHWRGAGSAEESSRQSMAGMKELLRTAGAL